MLNFLDFHYFFFVTSVQPQVTGSMNGHSGSHTVDSRKRLTPIPDVSITGNHTPYKVSLIVLEAHSAFLQDWWTLGDRRCWNGGHVLTFTRWKDDNETRRVAGFRWREVTSGGLYPAVSLIFHWLLYHKNILFILNVFTQILFILLLLTSSYPPIFWRNR